jgi:hypothetical protein
MGLPRESGFGADHDASRSGHASANVTQELLDNLEHSSSVCIKSLCHVDRAISGPRASRPSSFRLSSDKGATRSSFSSFLLQRNFFREIKAQKLP